MFTRREFFQSLAASALAVGVLPVGFPRGAADLRLPTAEWPGIRALWAEEYQRALVRSMRVS